MSLTKALYLIDVANSFDFVCGIIVSLALVGMIITIIGTFCNYSDYIDYEDESNKKAYILCKKISIILAFIIFMFGSFMLLIPSQKTMYAMLISDNYTEIKGEVRENIDYIFSKVDELMDKKENKQ